MTIFKVNDLVHSKECFAAHFAYATPDVTCRVLSFYFYEERGGRITVMCTTGKNKGLQLHDLPASYFELVTKQVENMI